MSTTGSVRERVNDRVKAPSTSIKRAETLPPTASCPLVQILPEYSVLPHSDTENFHDQADPILILLNAHSLRSRMADRRTNMPRSIHWHRHCTLPDRSESGLGSVRTFSTNHGRPVGISCSTRRAPTQISSCNEAGFVVDEGARRSRC